MNVIGVTLLVLLAACFATSLIIMPATCSAQAATATASAVATSTVTVESVGTIPGLLQAISEGHVVPILAAVFGIVVTIARKLDLRTVFDGDAVKFYVAVIAALSSLAVDMSIGVPIVVVIGNAVTSAVAGFVGGLPKAKPAR